MTEIVERFVYKKLSEVTQTGESAVKPYLNPDEAGVVAYSAELAVLDGSGNLDLGAGNLVLTSGDLTLTAGNLTVTNGTVTHTAGNHTITAGDLGISAGDINLTGDLVQTGNIDLTGNLDMNAGQLFNYTETVVTDSQAAAYAVDFAAGGVVALTLTGNVAITFSNIPATHSARVRLLLIQDGVGSHAPTWPATVKWGGGAAITLTGTAGSEDAVDLWTVGGVVYAEEVDKAYATV